MAAINTNIPSLTAQRTLIGTQRNLDTSLQRLSTGLRINSAKDDAAGLDISARMTAQILGMNMAMRNAYDGISLSEVAEGTLGTMTESLQRIRELAVQSANSTNSATDRLAIQQEVAQLTQELDRVAATTAFNGNNLFDGTFAGAAFQIGANAGQTVSVFGSNFRTGNYGNSNFITQAQAAFSVASLNSAGTLTVTGFAGTSTVGLLSGTSAQITAGRINLVSGNTGVLADAITEVNLSLSAQSYTLGITSNNATVVNISFNLTGSSITDYSAAITAFNTQLAATGVSAKFDNINGGLKLTNSNGNNINIINSSGAGIVATDLRVSTYALSLNTASNQATINAAAFTLAMTAAGAGSGVTIVGRVRINSSQNFSVTGTAAAASGFGFTANTSASLVAGSSTSVLQSVSSLDLSTVDGATFALNITQSALTRINSDRAAYGSYQTRFDSIIETLGSQIESTSAARGRIRDTDYAAETATLTINQVMMQAGVAMLAQANALPQTVLSLLK